MQTVTFVTPRRGRVVINCVDTSAVYDEIQAFRADNTETTYTISVGEVR